MMIAVGHVSTLDRIRKADAKQVAALAESIKEVGLLNPITVSPAKVYFNGQQIDGFQLVAGLHRLEACKSIGWGEIPAVVLDLDEQRRIIAECDENLCGSVLTAAERATFTARRKEAYEALHPETRHGGDRSSRKVCDLGEPARFTADTAAKTGQSERKVQLDAERGSKVCDEALTIIKGTKADTGRTLDALKAMPASAQPAAALAAVKSAQAPREQSEKARSAKIDADVKARAAKEMAEIIAEHVPGEWWDAVKANLYASGARNIADAFVNITGESLMDRRYG